MLVLMRKVGEEIVIGGKITLRMLEIRPGRIRLAIEAPRTIPIRRPPSDGRPPRPAA